MMELKLVFVILYLSLFHHQFTHSQQAYLNDTCLFTATTPANISEGYLCDGNASLSCRSFVAFRSGGTHDKNTSAIAQLFGSEPSEIAYLNEISPPEAEIGPGKLVTIPISCACPVTYFQHFTTYVVEAGDTYFTISGTTYKGLTTCQALLGQNPSYRPESIALGLTEVIVRVRCACPSGNQTASGVRSLLTYAVERGDTIGTIARMFGVSEESLLDANMLSRESIIFPQTPLLVPLKAESCSVNPRMFFCGCPAGSSRSVGGSRCVTLDRKSFPVKVVALLGVGIGLGLLFLFLSSYKLHQFLKKRKERIRKQEFFKQNGGILLQEKLSSDESSEKPKLFTAEELETATDHYNRSRFLGEGGFGTVYKGMLPDGSVVAVKKSKAISKNQIEQFINEVMVLSRINHRNVVKLLGFCLETETPLLVCEYVSNGTLSQHIREVESPLSWESRLSVACDVAGALAYMHSSASVPIFHRDIKSSNVLLDEKYNAKVSDFGTSRSVPQDKTHLTTAVQGTLGYMDPEYIQSSQFTDKSDVYSFGVMLVELLTGENPYTFCGKDEEKNLVSTFVSLAKENEVFRILDARVAGEADKEHVRVVAELAVRCLRLSGKKRPTMKRVAMELEGLKNRQTELEMEKDSQSFGDEERYFVITVDSDESTTADSSLLN